MKTKNKKTVLKKVHIIGICGAGLSALAILLKEAGWKVSGSDSGFYDPILSHLKRNKIAFATGHKAENIPEGTDVVVIGKHAGLSAEENPETREAIIRGIEIKSFPEVLAQLSTKTNNFVVAGSYGKSSVTSLLAWCLHKSGKDPSYFIGALPIDLKNSSHLGKGKDFIMEGDEYPSANWDNRAKFLHLSPSSILLVGAEHDHVNIYPTLLSYLAPFKKLVAKIPEKGFLVYAKNAPNNQKVVLSSKARNISYSAKDNSADWYAENINYGRLTSFDLMKRGKKIISLKTRLLGNHNIENIVGVSAMLLENKKVSPAELAKAISSFRGIHRRLELKNKNPHIPVYEDFGSSFRKARVGFEALKLHFPGRRIIAIFEPHSFSWRNQQFINWYENIFAGLDKVIMLPAPSHGKNAPGQLDKEQVWNYAQKFYPIEKARTEKEALNTLKKILKKGDIVIMVSSGSLLGLSQSVPKLVDELF